MQSEAGDDEEWDDSVLTKNERDTRTRRKVEAVIKRERALAYAYSHQVAHQRDISIASNCIQSSKNINCYKVH